METHARDAAGAAVKHVIVASAIAGLVLVCLVALAARSLAPSGDAARAERLAASLAGELGDLRGRLERLEESEGRIQSIEAIVRELESRLPARERAPAARAPETGESTAAGGADRSEDAAAAAASRSEPADVAALVAGVATEGEEARRFRELVYGIIEDERNERQDAQRRQAEEQRNEREEMAKGPYGPFNYKVNSLAKKLGLADHQKQRYYDLLVSYTDRVKELQKGVNWQEEESRAAYRDEQARLQEEFDGVVTQGFTPDQAGEYKALPEWQRQVAGAGRQIFATAGGALEVAPSGTVTFEVKPSSE